MALTDIIAQIQDELLAIKNKLDTLESKTAQIEEITKEKREVKQVVFDKEGEKIKVRRKVLVKTVRGYEEKWEEVSDQFKPETILEVMKDGA